MRALLAVLLIGVSLPAYAGCRLSTAQCGVIAEEMRQAEIAKIVDYRNRPPGMTSYQASIWVFDRGISRLRERTAVLPRRIADEYIRMVYCDTSERSGNVTTASYRKSCM